MGAADLDCAARHGIPLGHPSGARRTALVVLLTLVMMVAEIVAGWMYGSMALLADGWHMGSHAAALGIALFAYAYARRHADNPRYSFGTGKVSSLGGFTSGVALGIVALMMVWESVERLIEPERIHFDQAMLVAAIGLLVNLVSAWLLWQRPGQDAGEHQNGHGGHGGHGKDQNLRAAFLHVSADALTSVLAIAALAAGKHLGWHWLDAGIGILGAVIILRWTVGLLRDCGLVLLDHDNDPEITRRVREALEQDGGTRIVDLHVWALAPGHYAAIVSVEASSPIAPSEYKHRLREELTLRHVTVEVNQPTVS